jgi:hypothetical protein
VIERLGLGFLFGMAPPLLLYALDKNFGVPMTMVTSFTAIGLFTILGVLGYRIRTSGA